MEKMVFWKSGHLEEVVAHMEVQLYMGCDAESGLVYNLGTSLE